MSKLYEMNETETRETNGGLFGVKWTCMICYKKFSTYLGAWGHLVGIHGVKHMVDHWFKKCK